MLTLSSGHSAAYLTDQVAVGRESYYLDATTEGEPPGRWSGAGAAAFGLSGEVDHRDMHALYALHLDPRDERFRQEDQWSMCPTLGRKPYGFSSVEERLARLMEDEPDALPERVAELRREAEKGARQAVSFLDATFSVQKSVTVLHTSYSRAEVDARKAGDEMTAQAWGAHRRAVEEAIWAGNQAAMDYLAERAGYSRVGHHGGGAGRWIDAHDWTVASFFQHTSRDFDPQLHIHNAILNRVVCADGKVRTLDSRAIHHWRGSAAAVGERVMEERLSATLGVKFATRADGKAREIIGVRQQVMDMFSSRRRAVTKKVRDLVDAFEGKFGRSPNGLEMTRLSQQATMATRRAKTHDGETLDDRLARWDAELRAEVADGLASVARDVHGHATGTAPAEEFSPSAVIAEALAEVQANQAAWTRSDLARAINAALPDSLGGLDADKVTRLLDGLVDRALAMADTHQVTTDVAAETPADLRRADGVSAYAAPSGARYATDGHLRAEQALRDAAVVRGRRAVARADARGWLAAVADAGATLGADQAAAIEGVLTSGAAVEVLIGPAGTGKSYTLGNLSTAWSDLTGGKVFGLATSQAATDVLTEDGVTARNIARWLATQGRIEAGNTRPGDEEWQLTADDVVVIDEAAMVDTAAKAEIKRRVDAAGAKLILAGDPRQLAAVGAGGVMSMLAGEAITYELAEVRRFEAEWERSASLRLRSGDPAVIDEYDRRGRVVDGGTAEAAGLRAAGAWLGDHLAGLDSIVIVDTNEQAASLSAHIRAELVKLGRVEDGGVYLGRQGNRAGVGDLIQLRHTDQARGLANRARYQVREVGADGSIVAANAAGDVVTLPPQYVAAHVDLGYASTVHAAQGLTVDTAHGVVTQATGWSALYVGMTRGRQRSTAYVATHAEAADAPTGQTHATERRDPLEVLRSVAAGAEEELAALELQAQEAERAASAATLVDRYADGVQTIGAARVAGVLDGLAATDVISEDERLALAADPAMGPLSRLLRSAELAGHDPTVLLTEAIGDRSLTGARSVAQVLHHRIEERLQGVPTPTVEDLSQAAPVGLSGEWTRYMDRLGDLVDERRRELAERVAEAAPQWAVEALGPVPADPIERAEWEYRAGLVELAREATGHEDQAVPLGVAPRPGQTEHRAVWHAAWRALGKPEATREEAELRDGALRVRVRAWQREQQWAPAYVGDELRATAQAVARHEQEAAVLLAQADAAPDATEAARLRELAEQRSALAEVLAEQEQRLTVAHEARGEWYAETAMTRAAADRARSELVGRGRDITDEDDRTTAEEWLAAQEEAMRAEDPDRQVTAEHELADVREAREADVQWVDAQVVDVDQAAAEEVRVPEQRTAEVDAPAVDAEQDQAAEVDQPEPAMPRGVPTMADTAVAVLRAQQVLAEVDDRRSAESTHDVYAREAEQRAREAAWREDAEARTTEREATLGL
ncbi:MobF family relaxase [Micromonospora parva]|uniref:MobF family relaxase n=1 Tax=Micromonospora parva TaxID=1464048 RepID=UPI00366F163E